MKFLKLSALCLAALSLLPCSAQSNAALGNQQAASPAPQWLNSAVIYEANLRQGTTTRDFKGLELQLPRLRDLGVDIVWLMPIHPISKEQRKGTLGSYYAVQDYKAVNPEFGTFEDLKSLVRTAHNLGMKVILDEVCNHTGVDHAWVKEHPDYYVRNEKGEMFGPYDWTDVYKLDYTNPGTRAEMIDALKFWVAEADIDGYRCDVAGEVPTDFWEEARPHLQAIKPVVMLAEAAKPDLMLKAFDIDYAWPMKDVFNAIAATKGINTWAASHNENRPKMNAQDIPALIKRQKSEYPANSIHMNMITNHDLNSWEGTEFDRFGNAATTFAMLSYTLPGAPMLYTGQEVGFNHAFEFFEHDPITPSYEDNEYSQFYKALNALKHNNRALDARKPIEFINTPNPDVLAFNRIDPATGNVVSVIVNLSNIEAAIKLPKNAININGAVNYFSGKKAAIPAKLKPWEFVIFTK